MHEGKRLGTKVRADIGKAAFAEVLGDASGPLGGRAPSVHAGGDMS